MNTSTARRIRGLEPDLIERSFPEKSLHEALGQLTPVRPDGFVMGARMARPRIFSPTAGGEVRDTVPSAHIHPAVEGSTWRAAHGLAQTYLARLRDEADFSAAFQPCIGALHAQLAEASQKIGRLA